MIKVLINVGLAFSWLLMYVFYLFGQLTIPLLPIHAFFACMVLFVNTLTDTTIKNWTIIQ